MTFFLCFEINNKQVLYIFNWLSRILSLCPKETRLSTKNQTKKKNDDAADLWQKLELMRKHTDSRNQKLANFLCNYYVQQKSNWTFSRRQIWWEVIIVVWFGTYSAIQYLTTSRKILRFSKTLSLQWIIYMLPRNHVVLHFSRLRPISFRLSDKEILIHV